MLRSHFAAPNIRPTALCQKLTKTMKTPIFKALCVAAFVCLACICANAQDASTTANKPPSSGSSAAATAAKVPLVIVGSAAKGTWVTTKFTTKYLVAPVAKEVFLEVTPAVAKFAAKNALKYVLPIAAKWAIL
jgi:hypothetical protein